MFESILGHDRMRHVLSAVLQRGRLPQSLLFSGPPGVGKRTLALELARAVVCANGGCGTCSACDRAMRGLHPDIVPVNGTTKTGDISMEQLRELVPEIASRPFEGRARVFIFDADALNEPSSNALLKILEEPPPTSHIILISEAPHALLTTIRSRCQHFRFGALPLAVVERALLDRGLEADDARLRAALSGGSLGLALALESDAYRALRERLMTLFEALPSADPLARARLADQLSEAGELVDAFTLGRSLLRDVAVLHAGLDRGLVVNADLEARLQRLAEGKLGPAAAEIAEALGKGRDLLEGKVDGQLRQGGAHKLITADVVLDEASRRL